MKRSLLIFCLVIHAVCVAQKKDRHIVFKGSDRKFAVFMNTLSLLEPQQAAVGAGFNHKFKQRWDLSFEVNYLFDGFVQSADDYNSKGYRTILTIKRFSRSGIFFYGIDTRIKHFSYTTKGEFINAATADTLHNLAHDANTTLIGVAGIVGVRLPISKNKRWAVEINTGIGMKNRFIQRKDIPAGYTYYRNKLNDSRHYNISNIGNGQDMDGEIPYFPSAIRVMYFF